MAALAMVAGTATAQSGYPNRPITLVVPFPPGNSSDISMRLIAKYLEPRLKQAVIVENKAGGGGSIGVAFAARQPADGYTIVMGSTGPMSISPAMRKSMPYDPLGSFEPVAAIAYIPQVFVTRPDSAYRDIGAVIQASRKEPGAVRYGSSGIGSTQHLLMAQFAASARIQMTHVPYQGSAPAMNDLIGGQIEMMSDAVSSLLPMIRAGKLRPIAVTPARRLDVLPDVPTVAEQGVPGYDMQSWILVFAPAGTPTPILQRLNSEIDAVLKEPAVVKAFADQAFLPMPLAFDRLKPFMATEAGKWKTLVTLSGASAE
jgi:tripartite-type tricarboxylate transporter receptor subunit TctC